MKLCPHPFCLYFPQGLLPEDHLKFTNYTGAKTTLGSRLNGVSCRVRIAREIVITGRRIPAATA